MSKTVLITGCSSGIGYYCAKKLHHNGYKVFPTVRKESDLQKLRSEGLEAIYLDLNDENSIKNAINEILEKSCGKIDILFNNGAYGQPGAVEDLTIKALREQFETNLFGWHFLTTEVLKLMRKQNYGKIIQNSSVLGLVPLKFRGAYNSSKFAIEGLSDTLRLELYGSNIFISTIEPGPIESNFRKNALIAFKKHIDIENSYFKDLYKKVLTRLEQDKKTDPFTMQPEAVYKKVVAIIESKNPKPRYYVTFPTYLLAFLKRVLPTAILDYILVKISDK